MPFSIRIGVPEMRDLWNKLCINYKNNTISKNDLVLYKKWGSALKNFL